MPFSEMMLSFEGRLRRRDYWVCSFALFFGLVALWMALVFPLAMSVKNGGDPLGPAVVQTLLLLAAQWPAAAIAVKRCHDRDQSGWLYLIQFVPFIGGMWCLVNLGFLDGTYGPNKYGQSPKDRDYSSALADTFA